jgi:hypothetical protein
VKSVADGVYRRLVVSVTPSGVAPGEYALKLRVRDPIAGNAAEASESVRVD